MNPLSIYRLVRRIAWLVYCRLFRPSLKTLAAKHGTDKLSHGYIDAYAHWFGPHRRKALKLLEIGVGGYDEPCDGGNSLRMWRDYFTSGMIYSIDIADKSPHLEKRIQIFRGSQNDPEFLCKVSAEVGRWDVIIDDGSHVSEHVVTSFVTLFPLLANGGIYVIEDLHTAYWPQYGGKASGQSESTSMAMVKRLLDGLHHAWIPSREGSFTDSMITAVHAYPGIVFIMKGRNVPILSPRTQREIHQASKLC